MDLFRIIISVCSGTGMFPVLSAMPLRRVILHLSLVSVLLGTAIAAFRFMPMQREKEAILKSFQEEFGTIAISEGGLRPTLNPELHRSLQIIPGIVIDYFPDRESATTHFDPGKRQNGIIWTPHAALWWFRHSSGFICLPVIGTVEKSRQLGSLSAANTAGIVSMLDNFTIDNREWSPESFAGQLLILAVALSFSLWSIGIFMMVILFNTMFSLCYSIGGGRTMLGMTFRNIWNTGFYASLPALMIAALFPALDLPFLDFNTVYLIGFLGYFIIILGKAQRRKLSGNLNIGC